MVTIPIQPCLLPHKSKYVQHSTDNDVESSEDYNNMRSSNNIQLWRYHRSYNPYKSALCLICIYYYSLTTDIRCQFLKEQILFGCRWSVYVVDGMIKALNVEEDPSVVTSAQTILDMYA